MATARVQQKPGPRLQLKSAAALRKTPGHDSALRLLSAEHTEEIFPILLDEIVNLGFPRAALLELEPESGEIRPTASLNYEKRDLESLRTSVYASESPLVSVLQNINPEVLPSGSRQPASLYAYPIVLRTPNPCWEAERDQRANCLASRNFQLGRKLSLADQVCATCSIRGYAYLVLTQLRRNTREEQLSDLHALLERANTYLARLAKAEHYYHRVRAMETTVSRLRAVMQSMADPVILTDTQHRVIVQNKAAERFFRVPEGVTEGGKRAVGYNNLLFSAALSSMSVSANDTSRDLTLVDVMEGEEVLFEAVCVPTFRDDGVRTGMVTVMRDVTDLRRADEEVRANLEKLRTAEEMVRQDRDRLNVVIENVGDPIIVADNAAKIVLFDPLAKQLFGAADHSKDPEIVKNQARLDAYLTSFTFSFADKENKSLQLYNPTSRTQVEYAARSGKIYDARGQVAYTVTVLRDFSAWKRLEQLQMERRMLEMEKFAATGRLAGTIAHEINNPLESIKNAIHLLGGGKLPADSQPLYDVLKSETERVTRIVRQMLGLYRNVSHLANFDLNAVIEDTIALFSRPLVKAGVELDKRLGTIPPLKGSADQFRQLLSNLVVNSRDSMPNGGRLIIRTKQTRSADGMRGSVIITISDSGTGIPTELRKTIFEPFVSTKGEKGTGLGLWIVKGIVENHNGRIRLRSTPGKGTTMKLTFPASR